jgi:hypothetical protein
MAYDNTPQKDRSALANFNGLWVSSVKEDIISNPYASTNGCAAQTVKKWPEAISSRHKSGHQM